MAARHDVAGVVTQPDRPAGRGHKLVATPVKRAALERGLAVFTPEKLLPFVDQARSLGAQAFVVASYGKIVPQALLDLVPVAFNVHPSLLPLYRGATPLQSAIRDGRGETGVTIIAMDAGMDTGDVLLQERAPIGPSETYGQLHDRLALRGAELVVEALDRYANGTLERKPQHEVADELGIGEDEIASTLTRPLRKEDLVVDWSLPANAVVDLVRSLAPHPLARTGFMADASAEVVAQLKIASAHVASATDESRIDATFVSEGGALVLLEFKHHGRGVAAVAGNPGIVLDRVVPAGKPELDGVRFVQMLANQRELSARRHG